MNTATRKLGIGMLSFLMSAMAGMSAHAEDTEIFFGGALNPAIKPNILFILDTSGSMSGKDGGDTTRLDRMKTAFTSLMGSMNNANVGLMRFNDPGGPILYPITDIDKPLSTSGGFSGSTSSKVAASTDDAEQSASSSVTLDNQSLAITTRSTNAATSITLAVTAGNDDGEETLSNHVMEINNSSDLEIPFDEGASNSTSDLQAAGVIFRSAGIPRNAIILEATLDFRIQERNNNSNSLHRRDVDIEILGQTGTSVASFASQNIETRSKTTNRTIWAITDPSPSVGTRIQSSSIASVVQELVNQATWTPSSDIALFLRRPPTGTRTGSRDFSSYDDGAARAPILRITYEEQLAPDVQTIGLRFTNVNIPQGATITSASLDFTAASNASGATVFSIRGEAADTSTTFTSSSGNLTRSNTAASANWLPGDWTAGDSYTTQGDGVDLTAVVQEITNRSGWCGGNAMTFFITGSGSRYATSYEASATEAPALRVTYDPATVPVSGGCMATELSYRIGGSTDDVEHVVGGSQSTSGDILTLGFDGSSRQAVGLRFTNIQIPRNATISNAYLEFTARNNDSNSVSYTIHAENADNPNTYSDSRRANNVSTLATNVSWPSVPSWNTYGTYQTPDISSLIQSLVNRSGWNKGNAMSLIIKIPGASGSRDAYSFNDASRAPRLVIRASSSTDVLGETTRSKLVELVSDMRAAGYTPIVDTLFEASRYYRGESVVWGRRRGDTSTMRSESNDRQYFRLSHVDSYTGGTVYRPSGCSETNLNDSDCNNSRIDGSPVYKSPITDQCQSNHIVLLTDGEPTQNQSKSWIQSLTGSASCETSGYGGCGQELAEFLFTTDQSSSIINTQSIKTHTIGFNLDDPYLSDVAEHGGGDYYTANSSNELVAVFNQILRGILSTDTTFVSPGVTVNSFNRLTHRNEIYFALFRPEESARWPGNLKRYRITSEGVLKDRNEADAIDTETGFFKDSAVSYWSTTVDGDDTVLGGSARQLAPYSTRKVYTHYSGSSATLSNAANALTVANKANINKTRLGIESATDTYHEDLINWARGKDVRDADGDGVIDENRYQLSDPLHSVPHLVTYGGTDASPDITIYYGDNEGFLHAVDGSNGQEHFTFIPEDLLINLDSLFQDREGEAHRYGLDGPVNSWVKDVDGDLSIESADGDHIYVYIGMRRGGRNYYAIDATNRNSPSLLWTIRGGTGDFTSLGQTWSRPIKAKVNIAGTVKDVLIFAGGYDADQDDVNVISVDNMGNAIFMVDAATGALLWKASDGATNDLDLAAMDYSIPSNIRAIDVNDDDLIDQMYVGDTGGQLWRFDVNNGQPASTLVTGGVIADVSGNTTATARRFYHEPDVSVIIEEGIRKLIVSIGSGYQAHPLSTEADDRFYVFKQNSLTSAPADGADADALPDYVTIVEGNLYDATDNLIGQGTDAEKTAALTALANAKGWYIRLENDGEKVLSRALTFGGDIFFTTYEPTASSVGCVAASGTSRLYRVNAANATPAPKLDNSEVAEDRHSILKTIGLPPDPVHLRISETDASGNTSTNDILCVGTECQQLDSQNAIIETYWYSY